MDKQSFLSLYEEDPFVRNLAIGIESGGQKKINVKGLSGSMDMLIVHAISKLNGGFHLVLANDREEAAYLASDWQTFSGEPGFHYPASYKRPYHYEEVENANVLMRSEILNRLSDESLSGKVLITSPEAIYEKVINKKSLKENTFAVKVGEKVDLEFIEELLSTYGFEKADFVYEAGQFAVRGGIIDIFSYASDMPYRLELFGKEIDSIRTFDPESQLSTGAVDQISILPNIQTKMEKEIRQSIMDFFPEGTCFWIKDFKHVTNTIKQLYDKACQHYGDLGENSSLLMAPEKLFLDESTFEAQLEPFTLLSFGHVFDWKGVPEYQFKGQPQPSFNKQFELLVQNLNENSAKGIANIICSESEKQVSRLTNIFHELDPALSVQTLPINLKEGFVDNSLKIACYTDHQIFERFYRYKTTKKTSKSKALTLKEIKSLHPGDFIVHVDYGIGRFAGLEKVEVNGKLQEAIRLVFRDDDLLYVNIHSLHKISKYSSQEGTMPIMSKLGTQEWENKKKRVKSKVKDIAKDLIKLYSQRKAASGHKFSTDSVLQVELESSFIYEDTPDQASATADVKQDMEKPYPMDRLVCGDVGFGKTEVAVRAVFKAVNDRKQVAVLVPTTILAMQHYQTFKERLENFPVNIDYINRFRTAKEVREIIEKVGNGEIDILIGTHKIVNKAMNFKDLGLLVIDEEQKFGVKVKDQLKQLRVNVDVLTLTATPIPRTLHFSLMGARDLSVIATPPPNRQPVTTEIHIFREDVIRDAVANELARGGQVFFVHNRVMEIDSIANLILRLVPDARVVGAHGQMDGKKLEKIMVDFIEGAYDVLVSTNIIESGLDIPNANTIIINRAHMFGMSDLHQMRGRVGRSNKKAYCLLLTPPTSTLTPETRKRLQAMEEFSDLGDGFKVAMRDLDIRGAGNLLGAEQSGFISDLGFEMYHKILDDAVQELKQTEFASIFDQDLKKVVAPLVQDCVIETDMELLIPESYVSNISERLSLYAKLDNIKEEDSLEKFRKEIKDRFGAIPDRVQALLETVELRWMAVNLGFEKLSLKNEQMKCYFVSSKEAPYFSSPVFMNIIKFIQSKSRFCKIKETKDRLILIVKGVDTIEKAQNWLSEMTVDK